MTELEIEQIMMIGKFMGFRNELYVYQTQRDPEPSFIYKTLNEDGNVDSYEFCDINIYEPNLNWNQLIQIVEKIEEMDYGFKMCRKVVEVYIDSTKENIIYVKEKNRTESTYLAVVRFIEWYNEQNFDIKND